MIIYRVEHPANRYGPYNWDMIDSLEGIEHDIMYEMRDDHMNGETHPSLWFDLPSWQHRSLDLYCAFETFDQLLEWFKGYIDYLLEIGFQILEIYVPDNDAFISASGKQLFFRKENRKVLNVLF